MQRTAHTTFTGKLGRKYQIKTLGAFPLSFCCQLQIAFISEKFGPISISERSEEKNVYLALGIFMHSSLNSVAFQIDQNISQLA